MTFDPPEIRVLGELDGFAPGGLLGHVRRTNTALAELLSAHVALVDAECLAGRAGPLWHDPRTYALCKQPFSEAVLPELSAALAATTCAILGKAYKVLVVDLDNTLWGGVLGDDGVQGLVLGPETAEGWAFTQFQRYVRALSRRGVILAVCSKNDEALVREALRVHDGMVLREEDFAYISANFDDKASNIRRIAKALNVSLDSLVFADDNPVEREWVKSQLPEVLVIDLPLEVAHYPAAVEAARPFAMHRFTAEDQTRSSTYRTVTQLTEGLGSQDHDEFLRSLNPQATLHPLKKTNQDRVQQLFAKTNQFKLNSRTVSMEDLWNNQNDVFILSFKDKLNDYGIVAAAIACSQGSRLRVINWVMSCRVFARRLESVMLAVLTRFAHERGLLEIELIYEDTSRNGAGADYLRALGFKLPGPPRCVGSGAEVCEHMTVCFEKEN